MGYINQRYPCLQVQTLEPVAQCPLEVLVNHGQGLVKKHRCDIGADQSASEAHDLLEVRAQLPRPDIKVVFEPQQHRDLFYPALNLIRGDFPVLQRELEVLPNRHGVIEDGKLEHLCDVAILGGLVGDVDTIHVDPALRRCDDARHDVEKRRFAAPTGAQKGIRLAVFPRHVNFFERVGLPAVITVGDVIEDYLSH
jgi:hypothetical protein